MVFTIFDIFSQILHGYCEKIEVLSTLLFPKKWKCSRKHAKILFLQVFSKKYPVWFANFWDFCIFSQEIFEKGEKMDFHSSRKSAKRAHIVASRLLLLTIHDLRLKATTIRTRARVQLYVWFRLKKVIFSMLQGSWMLITACCCAPAPRWPPASPASSSGSSWWPSSYSPGQRDTWTEREGEILVPKKFG